MQMHQMPTMEPQQEMTLWQALLQLPVLVQGLLIAAISSVVVVGILIGWSMRVDRPAFHYSSDLYSPSSAILCPGDTLRYTITVTVERPLVAEVLRTWWSRDHNEQVGVAIIAPLIWAEAGTFNERIELIVPELPPGHYELRGSRFEREHRTTPSIYRVPFEIGNSCDD